MCQQMEQFDSSGEESSRVNIALDLSKLEQQQFGTAGVERVNTINYRV